MTGNALRNAIQISAIFAFYLATTMLIPALLDFWYGNPDWQVFLASAATIGMPAALIAIATRGEAPVISTRFTFLLVNMLWLTFALVGAVPLLESSIKLDFADAIFESMSAITTTGSTVLTGLDTMAPGILLWRSMLQWFGGLGVIALGLFILPFLKIGSTTLFKIESSERSERPYARFNTFAQAMIIIYVLSTAACTLLYLAFGMNGFDAVNHAFTTLSTGGFSTHDASFMYFESLGIQWTAIIFMLIGAMPFTALIYLGFRQRLDALRDAQVFFMLAYCGVLSLALIIQLDISGALDARDAITKATFMVVSLVTTTGFSNADYLSWTPFAFAIAFAATVMGGCSGSTSGGIKAYRWIIAFGMARRSLDTFIYPHAIRPVRSGSTTVEEPMQGVTVLFFTVFFFITGLGTMLLSLCGMDLMGALSATMTALANVGPGLTNQIGPVGNFAGLNDAAKWILTILMLLGRLELFAVLVLFNPSFWRR